MTQLISLMSFLLIFNSVFGQHDRLVKKHFTKSQLRMANTADQASYLSEDEKQLIQYLNLARLYPQDFADFYLAHLEAKDVYGHRAFKERNKYYYSLYKDLKSLKNGELETLLPCKETYESAKCWAIEMGKAGIRGHKRITCEGGKYAECCSYLRTTDAMTNLLHLLVDEHVESLGHRKILLAEKKSIGLSFQDHKKYGGCLVINISRYACK